MNRRKAIFRILLAGAGVSTAVSGYKWYDWHKTPDFKYLEEKKDLLDHLSETIIPATDSPGAKEAGTGEYIITMIKECTGRISQNKFIDGLKELEHFTAINFSKSFTACLVPEKISILKHFEKKGKPINGIIGKVQNRYLGKSFFTTLKEYTVKGYCTSKPGATQGLSYLPVPGQLNACIPLQPGQKSWATK